MASDRRNSGGPAISGWTTPSPTVSRPATRPPIPASPGLASPAPTRAAAATLEQRGDEARPTGTPNSDRHATETAPSMGR